jgi:hypothetical protein
MTLALYIGLVIIAAIYTFVGVVLLPDALSWYRSRKRKLPLLSLVPSRPLGLTDEEVDDEVDRLRGGGLA